MIMPTLNLLLDLRLHGIRDGFEHRLKLAQKEQIGYEEFFNSTLQDEFDYRRAARIKRLTKRAAFRQPASLEGLDYTTNRGLDKRLIRDLSDCGFIDDGVNIVIEGPTGVGKSYLSQALGETACRRGHTTLFYRMNSLIEQFALTRAKGTYLNLLKRLRAIDLLILDDFGIKPLLPQQYQDLYDVIDERSEDKSTIITSQVPVENWNEIIDDPVTCEAITDRLAAVSHKIIMKGESYRPKRTRKSKEKIDTN